MLRRTIHLDVLVVGCRRRFEVGVKERTPQKGVDVWRERDRDREREERREREREIEREGEREIEG